MCDVNSNIEDCCRICLDVKCEHVSVLSDATVHLHLKSCLGITVSSNDELPKTICVNCVSQLNIFYDFQLHARCTQDWLESIIEDKSKKSNEKNIIQPLPDSEYNSDSLLEFLNNTANIEEYLNNLGKEDIPSIVNMLDKNSENSIDGINRTLKLVKTSPIRKETVNKCEMNMEIDVLDSDIDIVKELLMKEVEPRVPNKVNLDKLVCFGCNLKFGSIQKLVHHLGVCETACRTCIHCGMLFDSKFKMLQHGRVHNERLTCNCGKLFSSEDKLSKHHRVCHNDYAAAVGCVYRCKICNKIFKERLYLHKHFKEHTVKANEKVCDVCGHRVIGNELLSKHRKEVHGKTDDLLYRCKICHHTSTDHRQMYLHVKQHTMKADKHLCETCGKSFATYTTLVKHSMLHYPKELKAKENGLNDKDKSIDNKPIDKFSMDVLDHKQTAICEKCGESVNCFKLNEHSCMK